MLWENSYNELLTKCKKQGIPLFACFEVTPYCNFKCNMCYIRLEPNEASRQGILLSTEEWINIAKNAKKMGVLLLELTGGEPTTRKDFFILYKTLAKMGFLIKLRSNGYLINGEYLDLLKEYPPYEISITLYGCSNDTYKKVCGISDGFSTVTTNITKLQEIGITPRITITLTKENANDVPKLKEWADNHNLILRSYGGLINPIRSANRSISSLKLRYSDADCELPVDMLNSSRKIENHEKYLDPFWMCNGFGAAFSISWDGRMTLCNGFPAIWKKVHSSTIKKTYEDLYTDLRKLKRPKKCETCNIIDYCSICPSRLYSETHDLTITSEELCRIARRNFKYTIEHNKNA